MKAIIKVQGSSPIVIDKYQNVLVHESNSGQVITIKGSQDKIKWDLLYTLTAHNLISIEWIDTNDVMSSL